MNPTEIEDHVYATYNGLRGGMTALAFAFPVAIYVIGGLYRIDLQGSLSAYYWANGFASYAPVRVWFVGGLFAIAAFLYLYKGFSVGENYALNLAAVFAIGVAACPMDWPESNRLFTPHGASAVLLFCCLGYVAACRSRDTLRYLPIAHGCTPEGHAKRLRLYRLTYKVLGAVMFILPLCAWALATKDKRIFFVEAACIWAFGMFWGVKSYEMHRSRVIRRAFKGQVSTTPERPGEEGLVMPDRA